MQRTVAKQLQQHFDSQYQDTLAILACMLDSGSLTLEEACKLDTLAKQKLVTLQKAVSSQLAKSK